VTYIVGDLVPGLGEVEAVVLDATGKPTAVDIRRGRRCLIRLPAGRVADESESAVEQRARNGVTTGRVNQAAGRNT